MHVTQQRRALKHSEASLESQVGLLKRLRREDGSNLSCDTENIIYYWKCIKPKCKMYPKCEYIGLC